MQTDRETTSCAPVSLPRHEVNRSRKRLLVAIARLQLHTLRLKLVGVPVWIIALAAGSVLAILMSLASIGLGFAIGTLCLALSFGFAIGAFIPWCVLRVQKDERSDPRGVRLARRGAATQNRDAARVALATASNVLFEAKRLESQIQERLKSEEGRRAAAMARLLAVDPGRLYPDELERHVAAIFVHLGFSSRVIGQAGDQGVDILAERQGLRVAVQVKRYGGTVGNAAVQEVYAGMAHHGCQRGVVVTSGSFTKGAIDLAGTTRCILVDGQQIPSLIRGEIAL